MYIRTSEGSMQGYIGEPELSTKVNCPGYEKGEIEKSKTQRGLLSSDAIEHERGLLIADFGVNWRSIKDSVKKEKLLKNWLDTVMQVIQREPNAKLRIIGYSDCVGKEQNNKFLRRGRAKRVYQLLYQLLGKEPRWKDLRSRIIFIGPAPTGEYVVDNSTVEGRAKNRGVIIEFQRYIEFPPKEIKGTRPSQEKKPSIPCCYKKQLLAYFDAAKVAWVLSMRIGFRDTGDGRTTKPNRMHAITLLKRAGYSDKRAWELYQNGPYMTANLEDAMGMPMVIGKEIGAVAKLPCSPSDPAGLCERSTVRFT